MLLDNRPLIKPQYKTAEELEISKELYKALFWVRDNLEKLAHTPFAMNCSIFCVAGWAATHMGERNSFGILNLPGEVHHLFYPLGWKYVPYSRADARHAIDTYLQTGKAEWPNVS